MKTSVIFNCEKCGREFENEKECFDHEQQCDVKKKFVCSKCGKVVEYTEHETDHSGIPEGCWDIKLGRAGYGSILDGCDININLCDDCLDEFIDSFTWEGRALVHNSGSNQYGSNEDWVKYHKGEMPMEEQIKKGYLWG